MSRTDELLGSLGDVSFSDGGHVLGWLTTLRQALRLYEQLLLGARAEVRAALSHQRWRPLRGELPPRLRAKRVAAQLTLALVAVRAAALAVDRTKTAFVALAEQLRAAHARAAAEGPAR